MTKTLVRSAEAARLIGIAHSTLRKWIKEGRVRPTGTSLGGQYLWSLEVINEIRKEMGLPAIQATP